MLPSNYSYGWLGIVAGGVWRSFFVRGHGRIPDCVLAIGEGPNYVSTTHDQFHHLPKICR